MSRLSAVLLIPERSGYETPLRYWVSNGVKNTPRRHLVRALRSCRTGARPSRGLPCAVRRWGWCQCAAGHKTRRPFSVRWSAPVTLPNVAWWAACSLLGRRTLSPNETKLASFRAARSQGLFANSSKHRGNPQTTTARAGLPDPTGGGAWTPERAGGCVWADLLRKSPRSGKQGLVRPRAGKAQAFPREAGRQVLVRRLILSSDFPCLRADKSAMQRGLGESRPAILVRGRLCSLF